MHSSREEDVMANALAPDAALKTTWGAYRTWAATARYHKGRLDVWGKRVLLLSISGAILVALGEQVSPLAKEGVGVYLVKTPGWLGSAIIALAAYFTREMLGGSTEKNWTRARSVAESLKAATFLYRAAVPPFDEPNRGARLNERTREIQKAVEDLETRDGGPEPEPSLHALTVDEYVTERVDEQIAYYDRTARRYQAETDKYRNILLALGVLSVLLGLVSAAGPFGLWVAVIATVTGSLAAYIQTQRYVALTVLYQATMRRLQELLGEWGSSGRTDADKADRDAFIRRCEETMALENGAWVSQWSHKQTSQPDQSNQQQERAQGKPAGSRD
jgi:SMODS and SLOG-associating 2TM effector domain 1/Protein of unknown function (DUF4231)